MGLLVGAAGCYFVAKVLGSKDLRLGTRWHAAAHGVATVLHCFTLTGLTEPGALGSASAVAAGAAAHDVGLL